MTAVASTIFQVPPFPGAHHHPIVSPYSERAAAAVRSIDSRSLIDAMRNARVGGAFWLDTDVWSAPLGQHSVRAMGDDPLLLLGAIANRPLEALSTGAFSELAGHSPGAAQREKLLEALVDQHLLTGVSYADPFMGRPISPIALVDILASWRRLIDANRPIAAAFGFAHWKRDTIDPLLWGGHPVPFRPARTSELSSLPHGATIAVWKARVSPDFLQKLEAGPWHILEVEDGFIRSVGLGADCVPPLSVVVDDLGVHYDSTRQNRLEEMLATGELSPTDCTRAALLRDGIVRSGISKYAIAPSTALTRSGGDKKHILVVGQVEDDRSVLFGSREIKSNLALLKQVRVAAPHAWIIYRPHPDVEAGHRKGSIPERIARTLADQIEPAQSISALISMADEVQVMTSLAGFEALLQGKSVTTHGTPFYAGWGLTNDLAPIPARRSTTRTIEELIAAVLLRYPRYLDPVTNLPCTAEILVERLLAGVQRQNAALVPLRRLTGWAKRAAKKLVGTR